MQNPIALMDKEKAIISDGLYLWLLRLGSNQRPSD